MGDTGTHSSSADLLGQLLDSIPSPTPQRSHWGTICFQATEDLDGGAVWAWEQYELPRLGTVTKAQVYQGYHSAAAMSSVIHALCRVYKLTAGAGLPKGQVDERRPQGNLANKMRELGRDIYGGGNT